MPNRRRVLLMPLLPLLPLSPLLTGACGAMVPLSADGHWVAVADGLGGELTLLLQTQGSSVSGQARLTRGALASAAFSVSGSYQPPALRLQLAAADGTVRLLEGTVLGAEKMQATLTWHTGHVQPLAFVRP